MNGSVHLVDGPPITVSAVQVFDAMIPTGEGNRVMGPVQCVAYTAFLQVTAELKQRIAILEDRLARK
jgi:hypothetical protein